MTVLRTSSRISLGIGSVHLTQEGRVASTSRGNLFRFSLIFLELERVIILLLMRNISSFVNVIIQTSWHFHGVNKTACEAVAAVGVKGLRVDARPNAATLGCLRRACAAVATLTAENELRAQLLGRAPPRIRVGDEPRWLNGAAVSAPRASINGAAPGRWWLLSAIAALSHRCAGMPQTFLAQHRPILHCVLEPAAARDFALVCYS